jgi:hypothetical protein
MGFGRWGEARAEHTLLRPGGVPSRMHAQHVAPSAVEPGEDVDLIARTEAPEALEHRRLEDEPGRWGALVRLTGSRLEMRQRRLDPSNGPHLEARHLFISHPVSGCSYTGVIQCVTQLPFM